MFQAARARMLRMESPPSAKKDAAGSTRSRRAPGEGVVDRRSVSAARPRARPARRPRRRLRGLGQRPPVHLAAGQQRQPVHQHQAGRHHVRGQPRGQGGGEVLCCEPGRGPPGSGPPVRICRLRGAEVFRGRLVRGRRCGGCLRGVRDRSPRSRVLRAACAAGAGPRSAAPCPRRAPPRGRSAAPPVRAARAVTTAWRDAGPGEQRGLDLAELDAEAADLDLVVEPAEELEGAVVAAAGEVAGAVEPRAGHERVGDEALRGQVGAAEVAAGQPATPPMCSSPGTPTGARPAVRGPGRTSRVLAIGRPMGTGRGAGARPALPAVTSTAASVGP